MAFGVLTISPRNRTSAPSASATATEQRDAMYPEQIRRQVSDLAAMLNTDAEMRKCKAEAGYELVNINHHQMSGVIKWRAAAYRDDAKRLGLVYAQEEAQRLRQN
jgi:hypothetical protein